MDASTKTTGCVKPWNKGKLLGQKPPLKVKEIWAIRIRLQMDQLDRFGRSGIRDAFDATYERYDDLSADQKSQNCSFAARAHETRKHS